MTTPTKDKLVRFLFWLFVALFITLELVVVGLYACHADKGILGLFCFSAGLLCFGLAWSHDK